MLFDVWWFNHKLSTQTYKQTIDDANDVLTERLFVFNFSLTFISYISSLTMLLSHLHIADLHVMCRLVINKSHCTQIKMNIFNLDYIYTYIFLMLWLLPTASTYTWQHHATQRTSWCKTNCSTTNDWQQTTQYHQCES